jgi:multiple sugar transport system permease protein
MRGSLKKFLQLTAVFAVMGVCCLPLLWLLLSALKHRVDMLASPPSLIFSPTLDNFREAFIRRGFWVFILNSAAVAFGSAALAAALGVPAAYALSRLRIPGRDHLLFFILTTRMAPPAALALPYFMVFRQLHLLDSLWGLIVAHTTFNLAFTVWTAKAFFDEVPKAIDDAAQIDGLGPFQTLRLILPVVAPGLSVVFVLCVLFSWNEFFLSMVLSQQRGQTLPVAILGLVTPAGTSWGQVAAIAVASVAPVLLLLMFAGRTIVRGLTFGVVKEG